MEAGPSRAEQQEIAWWNETMMGIGSGVDSAVNSTSATLLESMATQNGTDTREGYYGDIGWGGKDWLALFFMTFGKYLSSHPLSPPGPCGPYEVITEPRPLNQLRFLNIGWVLLFTSIVGFWRVKRWEMSIRAASQPQGPMTATDLAREVQARRNIESLFGFTDDRELETSADPQMEAEIRLARHLRAAGLI